MRMTLDFVSRRAPPSRRHASSRAGDALRREGKIPFLEGRFVPTVGDRNRDRHGIVLHVGRRGEVSYSSPLHTFNADEATLSLEGSRPTILSR